MNKTVLNKVEDALIWGQNSLQGGNVYLGHGFDNVWDEALALLLYVMEISWSADRSLLQEKLTVEQAKQFKSLIRKRINEGIPVAYLVNEAWFMGLPFYVTEAVLIPRSPLAELIEQRFDLWFSKAPEYILDLCTGSACIAIACAYYIENVQVDASDISAESLAVAQHNVQKFKLDKRVKLLCSDLFEQIPQKQYQLIISNPPYVDEEDMAALQKEYLHEPAIALEAGVDGLLLVRRILEQAWAYLSDEGVLIVEVGNSQLALMEHYPHIPFLWLDFDRGGHGVFALSKKDWIATNK